MNKFTRFLLLVIIVATVAWSAPLTFLQDANAYDGEGSGSITLGFHGTLVSPGSCEQPAADSISCTVFAGQESELELTATVTPSGEVSISAVGFLPPDSIFAAATGYGTVTTTWIFQPNTPGIYEARFRASAGELSVELSATFNVVLPELPKIEVSPTSLDFAEIAVKTTAERELTIKNVGDANLLVGNVAIEGGASSPFDLCGTVWTASPLPPGESTNLTVCFSPKTAGSFNDQVLINSNDQTAPTVTIPVWGNATKKKSTISCTAMGRPTGQGVEIILTVEISPPRSAEFTVKITDPMGGTLGPESGEVANGKVEGYIYWNTPPLEGTWKCEVSWPGDEEYEGASSQCEFKVTKLGSYEGTEAGATCSTIPSNRIDINNKGFCTENCSKIVFIQVITRTAVFNDTTTKSMKPSHVHPPWAPKDNDTIEVGGKFFTVDRLLGRTEPYYGGNGAGTGSSSPGTHNATHTLNATMLDTPWYPNSVFDAIKSAHPGKNATKIILEFETFAFCVNGTDQGKFYEGIKWKYEREKGAAGNGNSTIIGVVSEPSEGFKEALKKWCDNRPFNLPIPK